MKRIVSKQFGVDRSMNRLFAGASLLAILAATGAAHAASATDAAVAATPSPEASSAVEEVIVTGTRETGIKAADSAAPIEMVGHAELLRTGSTDLSNALTAAIPSLNLTTQAGDAAAVQVLAALRGLSPNDTLVLVDGKRRHPTSNLAVDGGSVFSGSATTDLSWIPVDAIDHIEVLTDGAAAQYGSDAIAGVVNIILKKSASAGQIDVSGGQYDNGQGDSGTISLNKGFSLGGKGFVNVTLEERYHDFSTLGIGDSRFTSPNGAPLTGLSFPDSNASQYKSFPYLNPLNGDPQYNIYNAFINAAYQLTDNIEFYTMDSFGYLESQHYENYRSPSKVSGVTSTGQTVYPFPDGFAPREKYDETDYSMTAGLRGKFGGWHWDLSTTYGGNNTQVYVVNSGNAQLFPVLQALSPSPIVPQTNFYNGAFDATEWTNNLDIDNSFNIGLAAPLNVAIGGETRRDTYKLSPGEPSSYYGAGVQSFDGYTPLDQGAYSRTSEAAYIDLATDPIKHLHVDLAGRFEHYSDFGNDTVGKVTARYDFNPMIAVRGTISTGFRAPTLAEEHYSGTNVSPYSAEVQLPPNSSASALAGFGNLQPEKSTNYSVGFVLHPVDNLLVTLDAYEIDLRNRILTSGFLYGTNTVNGNIVTVSQGVLNSIAARGVTLDSGLSYTGISLFANAANTRTDGIELTANYASDFGEYGHVDWSLGFNYNKTQITHLNPLPAAVTNAFYGQTAFLTANAASALTTANPREKVILQGYWTWHRLSVNLRETIYGPTGQYSPDNSVFFTIATTALTDIDIGYKLTSALKIDIGANNLLNIQPPATPTANGAPVGGGLVFNVPYGFAPYNPNGGYYYGRVTISF
jgi:iron complex outermembrane receptor protein